MTEQVAEEARAHLLRADGQEDLCFALWRPSAGRSRSTAIIQKLVLPHPGDRNVHGNVSFQPVYLERALAAAAVEGAGLALLHSHPMGRGWQGMSRDDVATEQGIAGAVFGTTDRPLVGLTLAGDHAWSARFWERTAPRAYTRQFCATVRVLGERIKVDYFDQLAPVPMPMQAQVRTISAWGDECQADLTRMRIGVIGGGSVGGVVADALGRMGFEDLLLLDFDKVEEHNLDRLIYATRADIGRFKVDVLAEHLKARATAGRFDVEFLQLAVYEDEGFRAALDCDMLICCVDRPWGRYALNLIAYAHLIPVFDGGISVRANKSGRLAAADWRAHTATVTRPCLQCLGQYTPSAVQLEREGFLDDPDYIEGLPKDHPLHARENVYAFALSCGSLQVLQMLAYAIAPLDLSNPGAQIYHFVGSQMEPPQFGTCKPNCPFPGLVAMGDDGGIAVTGPRPHSDQIESPPSSRSPWLCRVSTTVSELFRRWK
ncbi:MAG: ThiF family adenylyltransferase [Hyphomicrobiaceae bacterium]